MNPLFPYKFAIFPDAVALGRCVADISASRILAIEGPPAPLFTEFRHDRHRPPAHQHP